MAGKFELRPFSEINLNDAFFDSLKRDYPADDTNIGFINWFKKKSSKGARALVFFDNSGLGAFICLKEENESLITTEREYPVRNRLKISTLRIAERFQGQRIGEGAIGLILWQWQKSKCREIYVTVFEKHQLLIFLLEKFGFIHIGNNYNGERVYLRSKNQVDFSTPYKAFPFVSPNFLSSGFIVVNDDYHDTLFPYSELKNTIQNQLEISVANGITKMYISQDGSLLRYRPGDPVLIYRRHTKKEGMKKYKSCVTSYCVVVSTHCIKRGGWREQTFDEFKQLVRNKTVYSENALLKMYENDKHIIVVEMLYYGYFGEGHNINWDWLSRNGYFQPGTYPSKIRLSQEQFRLLLQEGDVDVSDVIID